MDQLINQLRSERREDTQQDALSSNSNSGNNFDITASVVSTSTRPRNQIRRPITRAAGYDSRQHTFEVTRPNVHRNTSRPRNI